MDFGDESKPRRVGKGAYAQELAKANDQATGTDFITGQKKESQSGKESVGKRTFSFEEKGKGEFDPVTGAPVKQRDVPVIDKAAEHDAIVLPRAAGRGAKPPPVDDYQGPIDPITGQPKAAAPVQKSSSGRLVKDSVSSSGVGGILGSAPAPASSAPQADKAKDESAEAAVPLDPITGQPKAVLPRRSSAGAMNSFMTKADSKGNILSHKD